MSGHVELTISPYILEELRRTLAHEPYLRDRIPDAERDEYLTRLEAASSMVVPTRGIAGVVSDPNDDPIIDLAVTAHVPYLVSGDKGF